MDVNAIRRRLLMSMIGGANGLKMQTVTINSEPANTQGIYNAIQTELGESALRWIAINEYSLKSPTDEGAVASVPLVVCGTPDANSRCVFRNDNTYAYGGMRRFGVGTTVVNVPIGTVYHCYVWKEE